MGRDASKDEYGIPNYVLKMNMAMMLPKGGLVVGLIKLVSIICLMVIIVSIIFDTAGMSIESISIRAVMIFILCFILFYRKLEYVASPMELRFYDDHLVMYIPKRYCGISDAGEEYNVIYYSDVENCVVDKKSHDVRIGGKGISVYYDSKSKYRQESQFLSLTFDTLCAEDVDFEKEIEEHSPIKVKVVDV